MVIKTSAFKKINIGFYLLLAVLIASVVSVFAADISNTPSTLVTVGNAAPVVSNVTLNNGSVINLTANATSLINIAYDITDNNGCTDINDGLGTSTAYRSGASATCATEIPTASDLSCYIYVTRTTSTCSGNTINVTDTVEIWYFADATDTSSSFAGDDWAANAIAVDLSSATGTTASSVVELNTLLAITVTTSSINYASLSASSTTGVTNQLATSTNVGNSSTTYSIHASVTLTSGSNTIATSSQRWATSTFDMDNITGVSTQLADGSALADEVPDSFAQPATSTAGTQGTVSFWGLTIPAGTATGSYSGTTVFTGVYNP